MAKQKSVKRSINFEPDMLRTLDQLAIKNGTTTSELVRTYVAKGLEIDGYKQDMDLITSVIRQELMAIYNLDDIKKVVEGQHNRLAKMIMKVGKISASAFFVLIHVTAHMWNDITRNHITDLIEHSTRNGIDYMQLKDYKVDQFLDDADFILDEVDKLFKW